MKIVKFIYFGNVYEILIIKSWFWCCNGYQMMLSCYMNYLMC